MIAKVLGCYAGWYPATAAHAAQHEGTVQQKQTTDRTELEAKDGHRIQVEISARMFDLR